MTADGIGWSVVLFLSGLMSTLTLSVAEKLGGGGGGVVILTMGRACTDSWQLAIERTDLL